MKALREIGLGKAFKFLAFTALYLGYRALPLPQLRAIYLRMLGAKIGQNTILHTVKFMNYYRTGFGGLTIGRDCFVGEETILDLASPLTLEDQVTLAERVLVLTHLNVGYADHPLQSAFPATSRPVVIRKGCFVGAGAIILDGVELGEMSAVAAAALVKDSVPARTLVGGVPARKLKDL